VDECKPLPVSCDTMMHVTFFRFSRYSSTHFTFITSRWFVGSSAVYGRELELKATFEGASSSSSFKVQGSSFKVQGSRFKVQGSRFKVQGSRFKVQGSRFKVQGSRFKVQGSRFKVQAHRGVGRKPGASLYLSTRIPHLSPASSAGTERGEPVVSEPVVKLG